MWVSESTTYLVANAINNNKGKQALLLYLAGHRVREMFCYLSDTGGDEDFDTVLTAITIYLEQVQNGSCDVYYLFYYLLLLKMFREGIPSAVAGFQGALRLNTKYN